MMKITICGSIAFYDKMLNIKKKLEQLGHKVEIPPFEIEDDKGTLIPVEEYYKRKSGINVESWVWDKKGELMKQHFKKIEESDAVLILNYDKNGISNYIGANTFLEIGLAFYLNKKIFLLNDIPQISYREEILGMKPTVINNNLGKIR